MSDGFKRFLVAVTLALLITACASDGGGMMSYGPGGMGSGYGTGGLGMGVHMGGWGNGYGGGWGHPAVTPGSEALDADPHATSGYYNTGFDNDRGYAYYHPARNDGAMP